MATIFTSNYSGAYGYLYEFKIDASESDVSISANTSKVTANAYVRRTNNSSNGAYNNNGTAWSITIDGTTTSGTSTWSTKNTSAWQFLGSASKVITHNDNGSKTITISGSHTGNSASGSSKMGNASGSGTFKLTDIPRYTQIGYSVYSIGINTIGVEWSTADNVSVIQYRLNNGSWVDVETNINKNSGSFIISGLEPNTIYNIDLDAKRYDSGLWSFSAGKGASFSRTTKDIAKISSAPDFNDEENPTITYSNPAGSAVSSLDVCISLTGSADDVAYRATSKTGTSYTFNLTDAERKVLRKASANSTSITVKFFIRTGCNGTTYYHNVSKTMTIKDGKPVFNNFIIEEADDGVYNLTQNRQKFIRKYSDIKVTIPSGNKMVAQKEATAKNYNVIVGDQNKILTYSSSDLTTTISNMDSNKVEVYAIDSRDNQTPVAKSLDIIDYKELALNNIKFERKNSVEETILVTGSGTWTNVNFGAVVNSIKSFVFRRKNKKEGFWSDWYSIKELFHINEDGTFKNKVENELTAITFDFGEEYDVEVKIEDELSTASKNISVNSGKILMSALKEEGVAFGCIYDKEQGGYLQFPENQYLSGKPAINLRNSDITNANSIYMNDEATDHEGINFLKEGGDKTNGDDYECLRGYRGKLYYDGNPVVDSGSNSDGTWVKWMDGTMICRKYINFGEMNVSNTWGSMYETSEISIGNYAQPFIETPQISVMPLNTFFVEKRGNNISETSWGSFWAARPVSATMYIVVDCIAIGKWK